MAYELSQFFIHEKAYAVISMSFVYHPLFDRLGGSLGKRIMGLRPVDLTTDRTPSLLKFYAKAAFAALACLAFCVPLVLSMPGISMPGIFCTKNRQAFHERWLNIVVIKK